MGLLMGGPSPSDCDVPCVPGRVDHISSCESLFAKHSPIQIPPVVCLIFFSLNRLTFVLIQINLQRKL